MARRNLTPNGFVLICGILFCKFGAASENSKLNLSVRAPALNEILNLVEQKAIAIKNSEEAGKIVALQTKIDGTRYLPTLGIDINEAYTEDNRLYGPPVNSATNNYSTTATLALSVVLFDATRLVYGKIDALSAKSRQLQQQQLTWDLKAAAISNYFELIGLYKERSYLKHIAVSYGKLNTKLNLARKLEIANNDDLDGSLTFGSYVTERFATNYNSIQNVQARISSVIGRDIDEKWFSVLPDYVKLDKADFARISAKINSFPGIRRAQIEADIAKISAQKQRNFPSVSVGIAARYDRPREGDAHAEPAARLGLSWTLFDWGRSGYAQEIGESAAQQNRLAAVQTYRDLKFQMESWFNSLDNFNNTDHEHKPLSNSELDATLQKTVREVTWGVKTWRSATNGRYLEIERNLLSAIRYETQRAQISYSSALLEEYLDTSPQNM